MFSWPRLPSVSLPASIQRRFLSFVLKRSLGHLVKPGQLDPAQIDAQIGSGFIQVNDVELAHDSINQHLIDLPIPLRLEAGSIGKISARIPWPNLTASVALSLAALDLTLVVVPQERTTTNFLHAKDDLAESVASIAESFIHDELSERENQTLQRSMHLESRARDRQPPGSMDPFLSTEDLDTGHQNEEYEQGDDDLDLDLVAPSTQGVSILATLIERLLARFEFDVSNVTIRIVLPRKVEFVLRVGRVTYNTEPTLDSASSSSKRGPEDGEVRTVKVADVSISTRDLTPFLHPSSTASRERSVSPFTSSSSSEEDEEAIMMMSQSLASLPPPPTARSISPESSMYHSATSSMRNFSPGSSHATEAKDRPEEKIISVGLGSEPVVLRLITPSLVVPESGQEHEGPKPQSQLNTGDKIRLTITMGPVAIALNPIHIRSLHLLSSALVVPYPAIPTPPSSQNSLANPLDVSLHIRNITLLLLQLPSRLIVSQPTTTDPVQQFFLVHTSPLPSPRIPHLRLQLDTLDLSHNSLPASTPRTSASAVHGTRKHLFTASLADLSIFAFSATSESWSPFPVLISDPNLGSQYEYDTQFPSFDVTDWTKGGPAKVSQWRLRPPHTKRSSGAIPSTAGASKASHVPVIKVRIERGAMCEVDVIPLHLFVDVGMVEGAIKFLSAATVGDALTEDASDLELDIDPEDTPPSTPRAGDQFRWDGAERERERRRLEDIVMHDFTERDVDPSASSATSTNFVLRLPFSRIQVRAPPPPAWAITPRSGALVLDLHGVRVVQQDDDPTTWSKARFDSEGSKSTPKVLGLVEFKRLIAASTLPGESKTTTFFSVAAQALATESPLPDFGARPHLHADSPFVSPLPSIYLRSNPVLPRRPFTTSSPGAASSYSLDSHLPSVHAMISKPTLDTLTFLADDITQCLFCDGEHAAASDASGRSRDPSLIGSRFFAKRTASTGSSESEGDGRKSEVVVKVSVVQAQIRLLMPRKENDGNARPLDVAASDIDFLAEIKPEGKNETVVTVGVMDLDIINTSASGEVVAILGLTIPRQLTTTSKSLLKLRFISVVDSDTAVKESRLKVTTTGFTYFFTPELDWITDVGLFAKTPEGAFESVIPSERTKLAVKIIDGSVRLVAPKYPGALVAYLGEFDFSTEFVGDSSEVVVNTFLQSSCVFFIDDINMSTTNNNITALTGAESWKQAGYALLAELGDVRTRVRHQTAPSVNTQIFVDSAKLQLHACADSLPALGTFASNLGAIFKDDENSPPPRRPTATSHNPRSRQRRDVFATVDEDAFRRVPGLGSAPDMIHDDLPTNLDYLDASFGTAAGFRELGDDDRFDFESYEPGSGRNTPVFAPDAEGIVSNFGGETIRMLDSRGIRVVEGHFENIPQEVTDISFGAGETKLNVRLRNCDLMVSLYDGYDWIRTRKVIEDEVKAVRRRLVKIRQLLASGQVPDDSMEETNALLFNSVYIGLPQDPDELEPGALIAAINEELNDDGESETGSQSSWQSFKRKPMQGSGPAVSRVHGKKLGRSKSSRIEFCLTGIQVEIDQFNSNSPLVSRVLATVKDLEILDHIRTSTWKKFLTELRTDFRGNMRETASDMLRTELRIVHPVPNLPTEEGRFRAKMLPIKLHVDQDALDFMKKFFSFQDVAAPVASTSSENELYFQHVEVFPVDIKLDYKPKRVDYKALREGKTIELMNFFHFDGSEITLRHITLSGVTGWPRLFETLNDLWTPDVKANQLAEIISGVSPVRSLVNVGTGVADLVLLPIAQYKKDKRVVRGVQKGTTSFVKSTAMEAVKLGARLATGTQVILEQAEMVLGGQGQFKDTVTAEALQATAPVGAESGDEESEAAELISKYADQPQDVRQGMQLAYKSLSRNFNSAAQTILAVPMEVYERSGNEGPVRAIVRAVPIAVLKPMIGASEAVSKTLFGLHNTMDPEIRHENEAKYKQR